MIKSFNVCGVRFVTMGRRWVNGRCGSIWQVYVLTSHAWVLHGQAFLPGYRPTRTAVIELFDDLPIVQAKLKPVGDA